jgi:hypothetical protein
MYEHPENHEYPIDTCSGACSGLVLAVIFWILVCLALVGGSLYLLNLGPF